MGQTNLGSGYPKYKQLKRALCDRVLSKAVTPGAKLWTEAELIQTYGVSVTTVRRAVSEMVREGIVVRKIGKGTYLRTPPGSSLATRQRVLLLSYDSWESLHTDVYYGEVVRAVKERLQHDGLRLVSLAHNWGTDLEAELADIRRQEVGALIFPHVRFMSREFMAGLASLRIPVALIDYTVRPFHGCQIHFDEPSAGSQAAEYLLAKGHRRFMLIAGPAANPASGDRALGFVKTLSGHADARIVRQHVCDNFREIDGYQAVQAVKGMPDFPTAIFCCGDLLAYGAIKCLQEWGLRVPAEVAVFGCGGFKPPSLYHPRLTTIRLDLQKLGHETAEWVCGAIGRPSEAYEPFLKVLPVELSPGDTA